MCIRFLIYPCAKAAFISVLNALTSYRRCFQTCHVAFCPRFWRLCGEANGGNLVTDLR